MKIQIDQNDYNEIEELIHSEKSPVGIDAKKTHILILHQLQELNARLERMEKKLDNNAPVK